MLRKIAATLVSASLACALVPLGAAAAFAQCEGDPADPSAEGVCNPAASITVTNPRDANFRIYQYEGSEQLVFPSAYDFYKDSHVVQLTLVGEDPTQPCDDNFDVYVGNTCPVQVRDVDNEADTITITPGDWALRNFAGGEGTVQVVTSSGASLEIMVSTFAVPSQVTMSPCTLTLEKGSFATLETSPTPSSMSWASSDPAVATVSASGMVTALSSGTATITATYNKYGLNLTASCEVTVPGQVTKGDTAVVGKALYTVTGPKTVTYSAYKSTAKSVAVPATVTIEGKTFDVTKVAANAFAGSKATTVTLKSTKITSLKNAFKGSKVKTVKVPSAKKAAYKKLLKASACGKSVTVK